MPTPALNPTPATPGHPHRQTLDDLIAMGADIARQLHTQTQSAPPSNTETLITIATAFDRIARAVRRCIALARHLDQPTPDPIQRRTAARARIIREVEDSIGRTRAGGASPDTLRYELHTRLDAPDLDDDISSRPVDDIIADICRDLGLAAPPGTQPWTRRTPADLHCLHTRAAAPSATSPPLPQAIRGRWPPAPA